MFEGLLQPMHMLLILGVALIVFGPKRLPEIGKALGEAIRGFKNTLNEAASSESVKPSEISKKQDGRKSSD